MTEPVPLYGSAYLEALLKMPVIPYLCDVFRETWSQYMSRKDQTPPAISCSDQTASRKPCPTETLAPSAPHLAQFFRFLRTFDSRKGDPFRQDALASVGVPYSGRLSDLGTVRDLLDMIQTMQRDSKEHKLLEALHVPDPRRIEIAAAMANRPSNSRKPVDLRAYALAVFEDAVPEEEKKYFLIQHLTRCIPLRGSPSRSAIHRARMNVAWWADHTKGTGNPKNPYRKCPQPSR